MGKPYESELETLPDTYRWAAQAPIDRLVTSLRAAASLPLVTVGSGGSFTTADFAAALHRELTGTLASAMTPMEAVATGLNLRSTAVLLATAGGKNPDALGSFQSLAAREPRRLIVLCMSVRTPLGRLAAKFPFADFVEQDIPCGKDGFLATNSLLSSSILLARAYADACNLPVALPSDFADLLTVSGAGGVQARFDLRCRQIWERETLVVLHGPATRSAAIDLESKFTEAALGNVRAADYRHFAHGRHHWLAKHPGTTAVLAFVTPEDEHVAAKTLDLLPAGVPVARLDLPYRGVVAGIAALAQALHVAGSAARARGIDPGRPGVPGFGRSIYHLKAFPDGGGEVQHVPLDEAVALERKTGRSVRTLASQGQLEFWRKAYSRFIRQLDRASLAGLVLDYDGTLCGEVDRFTGLTAEVGRELTRLLRGGVALGVATGRGKSVRKALRDAVPKKYWGRVVVGYYNGGDIGLLAEDTRPDGTERVSDALRPVADALQGHPLLSQWARFEFRLPQIKVEPAAAAEPQLIWDLLQQLVYGLGLPGLAVLRSSHSMDVLPPGVDKRAVVARVAEIIAADGGSSVLCIGDRGQWPGNDYSLLCHRHALSVDEVSPDPATCWNLAPPGVRCAEACLNYLRRVKAGSGGMRFGT